MTRSGRRVDPRAAASTAGRWLVVAALAYAAWRWLLAPSVPRVFVSDPDAVLHRLQLWIGDGTLLSLVVTTLSESVAGFVAGSLIAIVLAFACGLGPQMVGELVEPAIASLYAMPKFAFIPLLYVWLGNGFVPIVIFVALTVLPIVFLGMLTGLRTVDPLRVQMLRLFGASQRQVASKLLLPHGLGYLGTSLTIASHNSVASAVGAEILFGSADGLGGTMYRAGLTFDTASVLAALFAATVISSLYIRLFQAVSRSGSVPPARG
ncbi:MAG TPA: ABC transporter permease subunit [Candidatus Limnocylindria bacterium]|nr:ABC transporter permease subunit [Candidatus Limnocylindria bacterium]